MYAPVGTHPPYKWNWEQFRKSDTDWGIESWSAHTFVGFYWYQVSVFRSQKQIALTLPPWTKLIGIMSNLLKQMPMGQLFQIITFVAYYFDVIRWMLRRAGNTVALDEGSLVNPLVKQSANNLMRMSHEEREALVAQFKAETSAPQ